MQWTDICDIVRTQILLEQDNVEPEQKNWYE